MTTKPRETGIADASALARDLVAEIAAIATPPPGLPATNAGARGRASGFTLDGPRAVLENGARFVAPVLPPEARLRGAKALLLRTLRIVTRDQTVFNSALLESVRTAYRELEAALGDVDRRRQELQFELRALDERQRARMGELTARLVEALERDAERLDACDAAREAFAKDIHASQERLDTLERDRDERAEKLARRQEHDDEARASVEGAATRLGDELRQLKLDWTALRRELRAGLRAAPATDASPVVTPGADDPLRAGLYADFEHRFRGSEEEIRRRQTTDVALFRGVPGPVADLGCGRGEFLEALAAAGLPGIGCDANPVMVERAKEKGLEIERADLFAWLAGRADTSLGGLTAYQVVEHLPPAKIFDLVELAAVKLAPGGRILLETINPESVFAMRWFWMDLSHVRPVPAPSLVQLLSASGFRDVTVDLRSPVPASEGFTAEEASDPRLAAVARLLFAPQDYAVTGVK